MAVKEKIRELETQENMERVIKELEALPMGAPRGFASASVREDRDSG
ncbi:hypothetical protein Pogu_1231 [Pyrobaculum oguniense TE7]|uniref:Uncharacterized protein n=1 Tax=Pyrobaculum oguniense (strain DSM 13380 / JCM 10595 / TE7) TaxID=698757 RepID=H6Q8V3_PYROT|nr:hypothetical protein Pogu_1231 [Pyrobaculum oguniense TE7]